MAALRVLHVAAEVAPLIKTGGLADVVGVLPAAQRALGDDVRVLVPGYPAVREAAGALEPFGEVPPYAGRGVRLLQGTLPGGGVPLLVVHCPELFDRPGNPYLAPQGGEWPDNHLRFGLLGRIGRDVAQYLWPADVLHAHDWHAGLAAAYCRASEAPLATCFTIHNLAYHGMFRPQQFVELGLPAGFFAVEGLEFHGNWSFMKAGLHFSDTLSTVSPTYAREIQHPEFGAGLDGLLRHRSADLHGVLNGVDYAIWNPATDKALSANYDRERLTRKAPNKRALQREFGLEESPSALLFGVVSRLTSQKGLDLALDALPGALGKGAQFVLLGSGERRLEQLFTRLAGQFPDACAVRLGFDEALAHRIIAGADVILVPSRFEPCGLTQLYGLRYGTLPLVRRTGGLEDTVRGYAPGVDDATGFDFQMVSARALARAMGQALSVYREPATWRRLMRNAMAQDFGWDSAARRYRELYQTTIERRNR